jgi:ribonuclease HI
VSAILRSDGGARPTNPGHAGFACALEIDGRVQILSRYIGTATNNYAEYCGLIVGLKWAYHEHRVRDIEAISDSKLIVNQVLGRWRVKQDDLKPLAAEALKMLKKFDNFVLRWERRENNTEADAACTAAINWGRNLNPWIPQSIKLKRPGSICDPFGIPTRPMKSTKLHCK